MEFTQYKMFTYYSEHACDIAEKGEHTFLLCPVSKGDMSRSFSRHAENLSYTSKWKFAITEGRAETLSFQKCASLLLGFPGCMKNYFSSHVIFD